MDASKQISTISLGKWVTFRKAAQTDQSLISRIYFFSWRRRIFIDEYF
jgi:hypothetical protein